MNKDRRLRLQVLRDELETLQQLEEDAFYATPESLQQSPRAQGLEENANELQDALDSLDRVLERSETQMPLPPLQQEQTA